MDSHCTTPTPKETQYDAMRIRNGVRHEMCIRDSAKGDAVTIFSSTRLEWGILDFALAAVGAVSVPIYDTDSAPQAQRIMNDSAVKLAFADNRERFDQMCIRDRGHGCC